MRAPRLPKPWEIVELERMRRIRDSEGRERASIPLVPPVSGPARDEGEKRVPGRVVVIELG